MAYGNESAMRSGAFELTPLSMRPTIYRPSRPVATRVSSAEQRDSGTVRTLTFPRPGVDGRTPGGNGNGPTAVVPPVNARTPGTLDIASTLPLKTS